MGSAYLSICSFLFKWKFTHSSLCHTERCREEGASPWGIAGSQPHTDPEVVRPCKERQLPPTPIMPGPAKDRASSGGSGRLGQVSRVSHQRQQTEAGIWELRAIRSWLVPCLLPAATAVTQELGLEQGLGQRYP